MAVNLAGAFLIGFLTFLFSRTMVSPELRMGLLVGFLGSYTTFSTYMLESVSLLQDGEYGAAAGNLIFGNLAGLVAVVGGMWAARLLVAGLRGGGW
jgi:CrcB protein